MPELSPDFLIPDSLDLRVAPRVAAAVAEAAISGDLAHNPLDPREVEMLPRSRLRGNGRAVGVLLGRRP